MVSAQVKYLEGNRWKMLPLSEVVGESILSYMAKTERRMVAALLEDGTPKVFVCTDDEDLKLYAARGPAFRPAEIALLALTPMPAYVAGVFPDGEFIKLEEVKKGD